MTDEDLQAILDNHSRSIEACLNLMRGQGERIGRLYWTCGFLLVCSAALCLLMFAI